MTGTGKSTLVNFIIAALNLRTEDAAYIAYTGRAAQVLRNKGCPNATTAHKLLYRVRRTKQGKFYFLPKSFIGRYKIIILDEVSMFPKVMWELLLKHKIHIIALGDPFQLPAITEETKVLDEPHIFLDEIMRQAYDSEIIRLSMDIRNGKYFRPYAGKEINIINKNSFNLNMALWADQIICATNNTRRTLNQSVRTLLYREKSKDVLLPGEKVICLKNDWDILSNNKESVLVNGTTGIIKQFYTCPHDLFGIKCIADFEGENEDCFSDLLIDWKLLTEGVTTINEKNYRKFRDVRLQEFDYGYAVTAWKAQGCEWDKVLAIEENFPRDKVEHRRYLYTCVTRASKKLVLVLK